MVPPKKKRRVVSTNIDEADNNNTNTSMDIDDGLNNGSTTSAMQISSKDILTKTLIVQLDALESGESSSTSNANATSVSLLRLKSLQRTVLEKVRRTQQLLAKQALQRDKQELKLDNLRYQHALNEDSQRRSDCAVETTSTEIVRLVRRQSSRTNNENDNANANEDKDDNDKNTTTTSTLLQNFLGADWKDPTQRPTIVAKLNQEVAARKQLEDQLRGLKEDRRLKQESLASRQKLLEDLPTKLADMEKASLPLQKFCQKQSTMSSNIMKVTPKLGTTKRRNRLDLAKSLPKALYTVFHQLQSCLDVMETAPTAHGSDIVQEELSPEALPAVNIETTASSFTTSTAASATTSTTEKSVTMTVVVLKIPIPTVSVGGALNFRPQKFASITFEYDATMDVVLASCGADYDMGQGVIDELFPGDKGEFQWGACIAAATRDSSRADRRAYQWCNYLAGLHIAPAEQTAAKMHCSAKVIVKALVRRVRATATLSWILHSLSRKPNSKDFPMHAAMQDNDDDEQESSTTTKLSNWAAIEAGNNNHVRVYKAVLKADNGDSSSSSKALTAHVYINVARYPSSIPRWKILSSSSSSTTTTSKEEEEEQYLDILQSDEQQKMPLYNEALARLEKHVNRDVDQLVVSSDQTTYDWILAQQLVEISKGWEESL